MRYHFLYNNERGESVLTKTDIMRAKPRDKRYSLSDIRGLHIEITPAGRKYWRLRYTRDGKKNWYTIGEFPVVSVEEARERTTQLQERIKAGLPLDDARDEPQMPKFSEVALAWLDYHDSTSVTDETKKLVRSQIMRYALPFIGEMPIDKVTPKDVYDMLGRVQAMPSVAARVRGALSRIFKYAAVREWVLYDPCDTLRGAMPLPPTGHMRTVTKPKEIAGLLKAINAFPIRYARLAMTWQIYSMTRPGEARCAEWCEIDMERSEWRIQAERMKKRRPHIVPLSPQLKAIVETMRPITGDTPYLFAHCTRDGRGPRPVEYHMMLGMLTKIGYLDKITPHGFRGMASTILNENGFNSDFIERQLAHVEKNKSRASYNYADYLDDRRKMLEWYGDYLDKLRGEPIDMEGHD